MFRAVKSVLQRAGVATKLAEQMKMVLVVRSDLRLSKGKTASQCAHAAIICYELSQQQNPQLLEAWLNLGMPKIALRADSLAEINEILKKAEEMSVVAGLVRDAGRTQVEAGTVTVLGLGPDTVNNIDSLVKQLKLL